MDTVGNMWLRLAEGQPESITTEERVRRAVVYAQEFFDALAFWLHRPMPPFGQSDEKAEKRFRAIRALESLKPPSASDSEAPPSTAGGA